MRPTEILMQEHRVIEQVLDCLESITQRTLDGEDLDKKNANLAVDFFRNFADRCHHGKEEDCLFPLLEQKGFSPEQGPTGVMRHEHETGRRHVCGMADAIKSASTGDPSATASFVSHAQAFIPLLREHIQKEDHCLFQMADQTLSAEEQAQLLEAFAHAEHDSVSPGTHQKYLDVAADLAARYCVPCRVSTSNSDASPCGHIK